MEAAPVPNRHVRFGAFDLDLRTHELHNNGHRLKLRGHPVRVLEMLLEAPGELLTREEIRRRLWPDDTFVDFEHILNNTVNRLREELGDRAEKPVFIETLPRQGYRFICPVETVEDSSKNSMAVSEANAHDAAVESSADNRGAASTIPTTVAGWGRRLWAMIGAAALLLVSLAGVTWYLRRPLPPPRVTGYTQITHDGHRKSLAGTDGSRVYFNEMQGQLAPGSIAQVAISGGLIQQIPVALPSPILADVSADGANLLVMSVREGDSPQNPLWNVRILGGSVRRLGVAAAASFSPDGNSVAFCKWKDEIWLVRSDGTGARKLASVSGQLSDIAWSPDGSFIRFTRNGEFWEISASGANPHPVSPGWQPASWPCCGRWARDGSFFVFLSEDQIWALDERSGLFRRPSPQPVRVVGGPIRWGSPIPSRDGSRIFAEGTILRGELSRYESKTKRFLPFLGGISAQEVVFSNDGKSVVYVSYPEDTLWKANRDGSDPVQLTDPPMRAFMPRWSPDGTEILFTGYSPAIDSGRGHICMVPSEGGSPPELLPEISEQHTVHANWSPDGHKIVFNGGSAEQFSNRASDIRILDLDSRQVTVVPGSNGLWGPRWSPDGRYLITESDDELRLVIFDFNSQKWSDLPQKGGVASAEWSRDGRFIYFRRPMGDMGVFRISIKGGGPEKIIDLTDWHDAGVSGRYMGLDPTDAPLLLRDIGSDEIYALTLETK